MQDAMKLLRHWWFADRIRSTPGLSQLLQLAVKNRVLVRDHLWIVVSRKEGLSDTTTQVRYQLIEEGETNQAVLDIQFENLEPTKWELKWRTCHGYEELFTEDIVPLRSS